MAKKREKDAPKKVANGRKNAYQMSDKMRTFCIPNDNQGKVRKEERRKGEINTAQVSVS